VAAGIVMRAKIAKAAKWRNGMAENIRRNSISGVAVWHIIENKWHISENQRKQRKWRNISEEGGEMASHGISVMAARNGINNG